MQGNKKQMLEGLQTFIGGIGEDVKQFITEKPIQTAAIGVGVLGAGALGIGALVVKKRKKAATKVSRVRKKKVRIRKKLTALQKRRKKIIARPGRQTPYTARGGKDTSTRRIRHTKHGQPYIILKSGKARFISKASAKRSRKIKGGRY